VRNLSSKTLRIMAWSVLLLGVTTSIILTIPYVTCLDALCYSVEIRTPGFRLLLYGFIFGGCIYVWLLQIVRRRESSEPSNRDRPPDT
jgi:hypothetical protein